MNQFNRIFTLFAAAKKNGLKYPKIRLQFGNDEDTVILSQAGTKSKYPGSINLASPGGYGSNKFYGRIDTSGAINLNQFTLDIHQSELLQAILYAFEHAPETTAKLHAQTTGSCCFCGTQITTDESMSAGYGPICAKKYNLPWSTKMGGNQKEIELDFPMQDEEYLKPIEQINALCQAWVRGRLMAGKALEQITEIAEKDCREERKHG